MFDSKASTYDIMKGYIIEFIIEYLKMVTGKLEKGNEKLYKMSIYSKLAPLKKIIFCTTNEKELLDIEILYLKIKNRRGIDDPEVIYDDKECEKHIRNIIDKDSIYHRIEIKNINMSSYSLFINRAHSEGRRDAKKLIENFPMLKRKGMSDLIKQIRDFSKYHRQ